MRHIVFDDFSALHHESDALKFGDVGQRVAGNGDQIGILTLFDGSDPVRPSHHLGVIDGSSLDGAGRRWNTVGVSANIIDASFQALFDAIVYKLYRDGAPAGVPKVAA